MTIEAEYDVNEGERCIVVSGLPAVRTMTMTPSEARQFAVQLDRAATDAQTPGDVEEPVSGREIDLDRVVTILHDQYGLADAYVEQTGGGTATLYASRARVITAENDDQGEEPDYGVSAGPGWFEENPGYTKPMAHTSDLYVGYADGKRETTEVAPIDADEEWVAAAVARYVRAQARTEHLSIPRVAAYATAYRNVCLFRLDAYRNGELVTLIATELDDNPGASITNAAEEVWSTAVLHLWGLRPAWATLSPAFVEHYQQNRYRHDRVEPSGPGFDATWDQVELEGDAATGFTHPHWRPASSDWLLRRLGTEALPDL